MFVPALLCKSVYGLGWVVPSHFESQSEILQQHADSNCCCLLTVDAMELQLSQYLQVHHTRFINGQNNISTCIFDANTKKFDLQAASGLWASLHFVMHLCHVMHHDV